MAETTVSYKGRNYKQLWVGQTKYGRRAKLGFFDGTKEFWVDASAVGAALPAATPQRSYTSGKSFTGGAYSPECFACRQARQNGKEACRQCMFDEYDD